MDFDQFADRYDEMLVGQHSFFARERGFFHASKISHLRALAGPDVSSVLDFGCGIGGALPYLRQAFPDADVWGCDPSEESLREARAACPWAQFMELDQQLDHRFDVIYVACVMHHIPPAQWSETLRKAASILAPGGIIAVFEHNPRNPVTRWLVRRCPFDADAVLLRRRELLALFERAGLLVKQSEYFLIFPEALSWCARFEHLLGRLPIGGQYFVVGGHGPQEGGTRV